MVAFDKTGQGYFTFEETVEHPVIAKMVSKFRVQDQQFVSECFHNVFSRHMSAWDPETVKEKYGLANLKKVTWNKQEKCFQVYYKNGDWWHYTLNGEWY